MGFAIRMGVRIRAPREFVFQHLLTAHHMARWFCNFAAFDRKGPAIGSEFRFGGDYAIAAAEPPGWACRILGGEVLRAVSFSWPLAEGETRVDWRVEDAPEGSVMRVVHGGLPGVETTSGSFQDAWRICLGNLKAVAEARDDSLRPDSSPPTEPRIPLTVLVNVPPAKAFAAFVEPERVGQWTEVGEVSIEPRVGGAYRIGGPEGGMGRVASIETGRHLAVAWPSPTGGSRVRIDFEEKSGDRCGVYFVREGTPPGDLAGARRIRARWSDLLVGLKNLLEAGDVGFTEGYGEQVRTE